LDDDAEEADGEEEDDEALDHAADGLCHDFAEDDGEAVDGGDEHAV